MLLWVELGLLVAGLVCIVILGILIKRAWSLHMRQPQVDSTKMGKEIVWLVSKCRVCGEEFKYKQGEPEPLVCDKEACIRDWLWNPKFRQEKRYGREQKKRA